MQLIGLQFTPTWEDKAASQATIERLIEDVAPSPGDLIVLPEMGDTGWSFNHQATTTQDTLQWAQLLSKRLGIFLQVGYSELGPDQKGRNCTAIAHPDGSLGPVYRKMHPFSFGSEPEHFTPGEEVVVDHAGPIVICPTICYDLRFPELYRHGAMAGSQVFSVIASWPSPRAAHWRALSIARAIENQAYVIAVNRIGRDPFFAYSGGSLIVSPHGEVLDERGDEEGPVIAELNLDDLQEWRSRFPALEDLRRDFFGDVELRSPDPS